MPMGRGKYCYRGVTIGLMPRKRKTAAFKGISPREVEVLYPKGLNEQAVVRELLDHWNKVEKTLARLTKRDEALQSYRPTPNESLEEWVNRAQDDITSCALFWVTQMKVSPSYIKVKNMKSRWGSCTGQNGINLNIRLAYAPKKVLDYVVIHELCHIRHKHHQKNFWQAVAAVEPSYTIYRKWLKDQGSLLMEIPLGWALKE